MTTTPRPDVERVPLRVVRWVGSVAGVAAAVGLALLLVSKLGGRQMTWTSGRSPGTLALPVPIVFADSAARFAAVDSYVVREMRGVRVPGLALAIVRGDRIVHRRAFGVANAHGTPMTTATPFILGSLTKSFTALAVMQQVEAGAIGLDSSVQRYLPWFRVRDRSASAHITVRHLLNHTSGLPKAAGLQLVRGAEAETRAQQARLLRRVELHHLPGAAFEYSNANYWLLGLVLESATGQPYAQYVRQHILDPLRMHSTFTSESAALAHGLAQGYRVWFGFPRPEDLPYYARELAVGYLISTPDDMGAYLIAHLGGSGAPRTPVMSPRVLAELHTPPRGSPYAMGWLADSIAGAPVLWHTGAVANYHGDMLLISGGTGEPGIGVVILANANNFLLETQLGETIKGVGALMLGFRPPQPPFWRFREIYWAIVALVCVWLWWRVHQVATLSRWTAAARGARAWPRRVHIVAASADPAVALALLGGVPLAVGSPLSTLRWFVPDLTDWLLLNTAVSLLLVTCRLVLATSRFGGAAHERLPSELAEQFSA